MKRYLIKRTVVAGIALLSVPALFAQDKVKERKEKQQIVITADASEKTVIEINGDNIKVNGKDLKDTEGDVSVRVNKIKDVQAYRAGAPMPRARSLNMSNNDGGFSIFSEDENRAMLGVVIDYTDKGAKVASVSKESSAEKAGLKEGDIITRINDQKIDEAEAVTKVIRQHKPGDKVAISILRDGKEQKLTAELDKWKGVKVAGYGNLNRDILREIPQIGVEIPEIRGRLGLVAGPRLGMSVQDTEDGKGVKVLEVDEESNAAKAGIQKNDIITRVDDKEVNNAGAIAEIVRESREKASMRFQVLRNGKSQNIEVKVPRKLRTANL